MQSLSILLADEYPLTHKGIKSLLQSQLAIIGATEVTSCNEMMRELVKKEYTHLLLDVILSDGSTLEILPNIHKVYPKLRIMVLSRVSVEVYRNALKQYDIYHCLSKTASEEETILSLSRFLHNEQPARAINTSNDLKHPFSVLTPREFEVCQLIVSGLKSKTIGEMLNLKINTISTIKKKIYEKTLTNNATELIHLAELFDIDTSHTS